MLTYLLTQVFETYHNFQTCVRCKKEKNKYSIKIDHGRGSDSKKEGKKKEFPMNKKRRKKMKKKSIHEQIVNICKSERESSTI